MGTPLDERQKRIRILKKIFYQVHLKDDTIAENKLFEQMQENWGCTERLCREYINQLLKSGFILRDDNEGKGLKESGAWLWMNPKEVQRYSQGDTNANLDSLYV